MKKEEVPQDASSTYSGHRKIIYAKNDAGRFEKIESSGWEVEEFVTRMAVDELEELAQYALERGLAGVTSPLEYHMYRRRFDPPGLAQATGFFTWQVRRHLKPKVFAGLSPKKLERYQEVLELDPETLTGLPAR